MGQETGIVKWFDQKKGYGFITPDDGSGDLFIHISAVEKAGLKTLQEKQALAFDREVGKQGKYSAVNLKII